MTIGTDVMLLVILIFLSAFFSCIETAFFSLGGIRLKYLVKKGVRGAKAVEKLKSNPQRLLTTILIGNNLANVGASAVAASIAIRTFQNYAVGIATGVMTLTILIFGEITPKSLAIKHNEAITQATARVVKGIQVILFPAVIFFEIFSKTLTGKHKGARIQVTEDEIKTMVDVSESSGQLKENERDMIHKIFRFDNIEARDIMRPRNKMVCVHESSRINDTHNIICKKGFSRLPVYRKNLDQIVGFVHVVDIREDQLKEGSITAKEIMRPILFVPGSKKLDSLLKMFQRRRSHIAIVVDDHGTNIGLITMEDLLEEIVGEIVDEKEKIEPSVRKISRNSYLVMGDADMDEISEKCSINIPRGECSHTISGYILKKIERIPVEGETINLPICTVKINEMDKNSIKTAVIMNKPAAKKNRNRMEKGRGVKRGFRRARL